MTEEKPRLIPTQPWENGWAPDTSRVPGTRRLWMAGTLALSVVAACVTAIVVTDRQARGSGARGEGPCAVARFDVPRSPHLRLPEDDRNHAPERQERPGVGAADRVDHAGHEAPAVPRTRGPGRQGLRLRSRQGGPGKPAASPSPSKSSAAPSGPDRSLLRSIEAVNYPGRYWHVSDGR